jgi:hypothetical protein
MARLSAAPKPVGVSPRGDDNQYHTGDGRAAAIAAGWFAVTGHSPARRRQLAANAFGLLTCTATSGEWMLDPAGHHLHARRIGRRTVDPQELTSDTTQASFAAATGGDAEIGRVRAAAAASTGFSTTASVSGCPSIRSRFRRESRLSLLDSLNPNKSRK